MELLDLTGRNRVTMTVEADRGWAGVLNGPTSPTFRVLRPLPFERLVELFTAEEGPPRGAALFRV